MKQLPYKNSELSIKERVYDLISRMTLEEKIGQLCQIDGRKDYKKWIEEKNIGSFLHVYGDLVNEIQECAARTRLGIPILFGIDAIHGHAFWPGATVFPTQLALSCSWNPELIQQMAVITAKEVSSTGIHWTFSPVLCVTRDLRWGRVDETFGEDIYLIGELGKAMVKGYQGVDLSAPDSILACAKHFAGYSETIGGRDATEADLSKRKLLSDFLPQFEAAVRVGCATFMIAYQAIDGIPCTENEWLNKKVLRDTWGFEGIAVTDWNDIGHLVDLQHVSATLQEATARAINAGTDMAMSTDDFIEALRQCIEEGSVEVKTIDEICERILKIKFMLGLFDGKKVALDKEKVGKIVGCREHREIALECSRQSIVLLKNENNILPFGPDIKRIGVFGPNADDMDAQLGDWSFHSAQIGEQAKKHPRENIVTVLDGIKKRSGSGITVEYCYGCGVLDDGHDEIDRAVEIAKKMDVAIVVVGDNLSLNGEGKDRANLDLTGKQLSLLQSIYKTGVSMIVVLINGKPLSIPWIKENATAILEAWNPGMEGGSAISEILFGDVIPSGKLTVSFPYHVGQLPVYYNQIPGWHAAKYSDLPTNDSLFPFGFGLSYTTFKYSNLTVSKNKLMPGDTCIISIYVENTGNFDGVEIVQLYIHDIVSSVTTPKKLLKGFSRVHINKNEKKQVELSLEYEKLSFVNSDLKRVVEPGIFEVMVGGSSEDKNLLKTEIEVI
jgi:beta-glucosidase